MAYSYSTQGYDVNSGGQRIVVDPVTRIEGHLRCEANLDANNVITNAVSSGTMFRGLEIILKDRDPRDAWAFCERICGVCTGTHALASVHAVENALGIDIPDNANIIRNLMQLALWYHDHIVHFYHLAGLDWIDVVSATKADPKETATLAQKLSDWYKSSPGYFSDVKGRLVRFVESGQLGIFKNGYWGHPAYKLSPEANLMLFAHYLEALDFQKEVVKIHTVFGGKNPHPNWLVGGVPCSLNLDGRGGADVINNERLQLVDRVISQCQAFATQVVYPDIVAMGRFYPEWFSIGTGLSDKSVLSYGAFPSIANDYSNNSLLVPGGAIINGNFEEVLPIDLLAPDQVQEAVAHSWYSYPNKVINLHPFDGETDPHFELGPDTKGTPVNIQELDERGPYSWIKTPRWRGQMMEVGPLARHLVAYALKTPYAVEAIDRFCHDLNVPVTAMRSTLGRLATRSLEVGWSADTMRLFYDRLVANLRNGQVATANMSKWEPQSWPKSARGVGFTEAPRGALGHWIEIRDQKIARYQCVVPTTWNSAARSPEGQISAYEASLMGTRLAKPEEPLEVLRTVHSFDPCLACATHIIGPSGDALITVQSGL